MARRPRSRQFKAASDDLPVTRLADFLDVSRSTVFHWLRGTRAPGRLMRRELKKANIQLIRLPIESAEPDAHP